MYILIMLCVKGINYMYIVKITNLSFNDFFVISSEVFIFDDDKVDVFGITTGAQRCNYPDTHWLSITAKKIFF